MPFKWASMGTACFLVFSAQLGIQTLPFLLTGELFPSGDSFTNFLIELYKKATRLLLGLQSGKSIAFLIQFTKWLTTLASDVRSLCKGITNSVSCFYFLFILKMYPSLQNDLNIYGTFYLVIISNRLILFYNKKFKVKLPQN